MSPIPLYPLIKGKHGHILLHAIRNASPNSSLDLALNVGHTVEDGFYRIVQYNEDSTVYDATLTSNPTSVGQTSIPVEMYSGTHILPRVWKLTRQYGVDDGFTIVPVTDPISTPPGLGATTLDKNKVVVVEKDSCYPIWTVRCDERIDYQNPDGTTTTIYLFRILEVATDLCWKTNNSDRVVIDTASGQPPAANQLYQLILTPPVTIVVANSVDQVVTTAVDANTVRKYYFGYTAEKKEYVSLQLSTDARDQGWADEPQSGLWSWFEIAILFTAPQPGTVVEEDQIKRDSSGKLCTWTSHAIPLTSSYTEQTGPLFNAPSPLWKNLEEGNVISVLVAAKFRAWKGDARRGNLAIEELV